MDPIAYTTVINANRPGLWPCHEGYADNQVTPKARHNSDGEEPYEKTEVAPKLPRQLRNYILDHYSRAAFSEGLCRLHFGLKWKPKSRHVASSIGKRNHKATNRQWSHHIIIDVELATHIVHPTKCITLQSKYVCERTSFIARNGI